MANRHLVVVEDDQHIGSLMARMRQRFKSHASCDGAIANNGYDFPVDALLLCRHRHPHCCGDAGRGVADTKCIEGTLRAFRKARQSSNLAHRAHFAAAPGENLVRIGLVSHVPDNAVMGRTEYVVQCHGQFNDSQAGAKVTASSRHRIEEILTKLFRQTH